MLHLCIMALGRGYLRHGLRPDAQACMASDWWSSQLSSLLGPLVTDWWLSQAFFFQVYSVLYVIDLFVIVLLELIESLVIFIDYMYRQYFDSFV